MGGSVQRNRGARSVRLLVRCLVFLTLAGGCRTSRESNLGFHLDRNQPVVTSIRVEGQTGRFVVASALPRTVVSSRFASEHLLDPLSPIELVISETRRVVVDPNILDLGDDIDALIGIDVIGPVFSIDYRRGTVSTSQRADLFTPDMIRYEFSDLPSLPVRIDGIEERAIVDTSLPDTLVIPLTMFEGATPGRSTATVEIGGVQLIDLDVLFADVTDLRLGNRILARFLLTVDTRVSRIGLWEY